MNYFIKYRCDAFLAIQFCAEIAKVSFIDLPGQVDLNKTCACTVRYHHPDIHERAAGFITYFPDIYM
ncbi:hypothetical protein CXP47_01665 [Pseudomonas chlororaphis]|nr:hypothetical protein CXP47_01665 [Pseudomonas chlororaphis]